MKAIILLLCGMALCLLTQAQTNRYSYNWQLHEKLIDEQFAKKYKAEVLASERKAIEIILPKENADAYMKQFEAGMDAGGGMRMIEHGGKQKILLEFDYASLLEQAYAKGVDSKVLFRRGYFEGMAKSAEHPDVVRPAK
jgi:hypothetical protein